MSSRPVLIAVDWGTSSMRAALLGADGATRESRDGGAGVLTVADGAFRAALDAMTADWRRQHGPLPVVLTGMVGSRQGWREVPYLACPADATTVARALMQVDTADGASVLIAPGLMLDAGGAPDVMRGEETQIFGAMAALAVREGRFVLPGTHSKWVEARDSAITGFATYMTGEVFAALRNHTILGRTMPSSASPFDASAFADGVAAGAADGRSGALLQRLFSVRTLALFDRVAAPALESYLSGLLIGAECTTASMARRGEPATSLTIVGNAVLADRYARALDQLGQTAAIAPADCAARGAFKLATAAGLVG